MNGNEAMPTFEANEQGSARGEVSFDEVTKRIEQLVFALQETLDSYRSITMPDGHEIEAANEHEELLAKAQTLRLAIEGMQEGCASNNDRYGEEAAALSIEALKHMEGLLAVRADLMNRAARNPAAARLAIELDLVTQALLPQVSARNDEVYELPKVA